MKDIDSPKTLNPLADEWADPSKTLSRYASDHFECVDLTADEHEAAVRVFLKKGGSVKKVDQGVVSGVALEPRNATIHFGRKVQPFRRNL